MIPAAIAATIIPAIGPPNTATAYPTAVANPKPMMSYPIQPKIAIGNRTGQPSQKTTRINPIVVGGVAKSFAPVFSAVQLKSSKTQERKQAISTTMKQQTTIAPAAPATFRDGFVVVCCLNFIPGGPLRLSTVSMHMHRDSQIKTLVFLNLSLLMNASAWR